MDDSAGIRRPQERTVFNKIIYPPPNKHFKYNQKAIDKMILEGRIRFKEPTIYNFAIICLMQT